ncbi:hypothetical protein, partial [Citrobacter youngae]|uniref:hypothetical protein n=1 Tax=Citrobacter youngae TaxID=133448 RepID=UPI0019549B3D
KGESSIALAMGSGGLSVQLRLSVLIFRKHFPAGSAPPAPTFHEVLSALLAGLGMLWSCLLE